MRTIRNCNVAVVGGAGFLGSHLVDHLVDDRNCQVLVIDNLVAGRREFVHGLAQFVHADITGSEEYLRNLFVKTKTQYVFNYAAFPYVPDSFARPMHVSDVNFMGALKVINAAQEAGCEGILQVSSAEIYGEGNIKHAGLGEYEWQKIDETCPVRPHSTYGASKAAVDALVQVRFKEAQTPVIALRQFNCCGPRETHPYVIPEIISQLAKSDGKKNPVVRLGNDSYRDFQYSGDAVRMATELLEKGRFGEVYNMGSEEGVKIYRLAEILSGIMCPEWGELCEVSPDSKRMRPWEIWHLQSDNTKLYSVIESRPTTTLDEALTETIEDFRRNNNRWCWESR